MPLFYAHNRPEVASHFPWSVSSAVAHFVHTEGVAGSNPISTTITELRAHREVHEDVRTRVRGAGNDDQKSKSEAEFYNTILTKSFGESLGTFLAAPSSTSPRPSPNPHQNQPRPAHLAQRPNEATQR